MKKTNLDEMQEQKMLTIESKGHWVALWGLLVAIAVQLLLGMSLLQVAGELIIFLGMCIFLITACLRNGLWDRKLEPNLKTNLLVSLFAGLGITVFEVFYLRTKTDDFLLSVKLAILLGALTTLLCLISSTVLGKVYQNRRKNLDQE